MAGYYYTQLAIEFPCICTHLNIEVSVWLAMNIIASVYPHQNVSLRILQLGMLVHLLFL